jgi:hypothetical protein
MHGTKRAPMLISVALLGPTIQLKVGLVAMTLPVSALLRASSYAKTATMAVKKSARSVSALGQNGG